MPSFPVSGEPASFNQRHWVPAPRLKHSGAASLASLPTEMSGRNWMMRRLIIDSIRNDPEWMNGNYTKQPA